MLPNLRADEGDWGGGGVKYKPGRLIEAEGLRKDGTTFPMEHTVSVEKTAHGMRFTAILRDVTERKRAEEEIRRLKEFNEEIVQRMEEGVVTLDEEGRITFFNPKALAMLGYAKGELKGKPFETVCCCNRAEIQQYLAKVREGHPTKFECTLTIRDGKELVALNSCTSIFRGGKFDGYLMTLTDITEWKVAEEAFVEKSLKYNITRESLYLSEELEMEKAMDAFKDLLRAGYKGMIITRRYPEEVQEKYQLEEETPIYWLGSEAAPGTNVLQPELSIIEKEVREFLGSRRVLLIDRLEYLVSQRGFEETLASVQRIHEMVYARKGIGLLSLDPATFPPHQLALLRSETRGLERREGPAIPEDLLEILQFIHGENREGKKPTPKELTKHFGFSRMTCLTKLKRLKALGLITEEQMGRTRPVWVTEKGKDLL